MSHSPDLQKSLQTITKELETLETTIQHRKNELKSVDQELSQAQQHSKLRISKVRTESQALIEKITRETEDKLLELRNSVGKEEEILQIVRKYIEVDKKTLEPLIQKIEDANLELQNIKTVKANLQDLIKSESDRLSAIQKERSEISDKIELLNLQKITLDEEITLLKKEKSDLEVNIEQLSAEFDVVKSEKEKQIAVLEAKKNNIVIEINEQSAKMENALHDIATRHKLLEERDQNLRVRERKVEEGEGKIIRNSNLLEI